MPENWPPQFQTDENGQPYGFAIDVFDQIADLAGVEVVYKSYPSFALTVEALIRGEGDVIPNSGILTDRFQEFAFSSPIETFHVSIVVRDDTTDISEFPDLYAKRVAVVERNVGYFMLKKHKGLFLSVKPDLQSALLALVSGNEDALVYPESVVFALARKAGIEHRIKTAGEPLLEVKRGIRALKANSDVLQRLEPFVQEFVQSAAYARTYEKWYGTPKPLLTNQQIYYLLFATTAFLVIFAIFWRQASLNRLNRDLRLRNAEQTKTLKALYDVTSLLRSPSRTLAPLADPLTKAIRAGFRFPDHTHVRVRAGDEMVATPGFSEADDFIAEPISASGSPIGQLAVSLDQKDADPRTPRRFQAAERELVKGLATKFGQFFEASLAYGRLRVALHEKDTLVQEIHHRVKNNLQVILSIISLQRRSADGDHEREALSETSRRVRVMSSLYESLYQSDDVSRIPAQDYLQGVFEDAISSHASVGEIETEFHADDVVFDIKTATACAQIASELISNALKHAFPQGRGKVSLFLTRLEDGHIRLRVRDDGIGLPEGLDESKLRSMGIKLVNALVAQIGGEKTMRSENGTIVDIVFGEGNHDKAAHPHR
ncbi:MAG: transporter substrate-binding domain-containing protein [Alphaproteobacteria bacterium]|nr:transporter substrate-binding domain-containing protein [Alphaproteobacteria bacterium]